MPYKARFSRVFLKKEERLPSDLKPRVVEALREILTNPHVGVPLVGPLKGLWRVTIWGIRFLRGITRCLRGCMTARALRFM